MDTITEIIPDRSEWPEWAKDAFDSGQFFNVVSDHMAQDKDIRDHYETMLTLISEALNVSYEPHQTFNDRLLTAAHEAGKVNNVS